MSLSKLSLKLLGQPMFQILDEANRLEKEGKEVFHLEIGDTSYPTNPIIIDSTKRALDLGLTQYGPSSGTSNLKQQIIKYTSSKLNYLPFEEQILIMPANAVIDSVIRCLMNEKDECLIPDPGFPTYSSVLNYLELDFKYYDIIDKYDEFTIDISSLKKQISQKTKLLIINSPSNPTGMVIKQEILEELYKLAHENDFYILSDEVYSELVYGKAVYSSITINDYCEERTILLNSFSKNFQMSGYRLGYVIAPEFIAKKLTLLYETVYSCTSPFIQYAGMEALKNSELIVSNILEKYNKTKQLVYERANSIKGMKCNRIDGAIYAFIDISELNISGDEFSKIMLYEIGVAVLPGSYFGTKYSNYVRINFARDYDYLNKAFDKIESFMKWRFK